VTTLRPGHAEVSLRDRRKVRNHLASIHALALANAGELASGLAMHSALPQSVRGIVVRLEIEFLKKARGTVTATATPEIPEVQEPVEHAVSADIRDEAGDVVARVTTVWRLAPREE
jgi:acyl-coenzyme A thioesterase PaaI-like protein